MKPTLHKRQDLIPSGYRVELLVSEFGERHSLVVSRSSGLPLFFPSVWLTSHRRSHGLAAGTLTNNAQTIASLYSWAEVRGINLDDQFREGIFLRQWEVADLADHLREEVRSQPRRPKVQRFKPSEPAREPIYASVVTPGVGNYRLDIAADYLYWLGTEAAHRFRNESRKTNADEAEMQRNEMISQLARHKQVAKGRNSLNDRMAPEPGLIARLLEVVQVNHPENPWADPPKLVEAMEKARLEGNHREAQRLQTILTSKLAIRLRNRLIVHLLYHQGVRRGELLGLKARDLKGQSLFVLRHPDDPEDTRTYQPNTKTRDRKLPMNSGLQVMWLDYVSLVRAKFTLARKHPFLIANHRDGSPLSFSGLAKIFHDLRTVEGLPNNLTPHHLRHAWNEKFSELADEQKLDHAREAQIRAELMGWNPGTRSPTALIYLRRHTKRKAQEVSLRLQEEMMHPREDDHE